MRMENSPEFEKKMEEHRREREEKKTAAARLIQEAIDAGYGTTWTPMDKCPFAGLELWEGSQDPILVTDGKSVTVVTVSDRFGTPVFYKKQPEMVYRDGMMHMEGGEIDPRDDLPKWWWEWELKDELEDEVTYYDSSSKPEVAWVPTHWMWMPKPPATNSAAAPDA